MQFIVDNDKDSLSWAQWHLANGTFPRDEYRELNELIVVYLGGAVPGVQAKDFVRQLLTINDGAERDIKLMKELIDRTQDEQDLQYLAQCVTHHRKKIGHKKKDYEKLAALPRSNLNFAISFLTC